MDYVAAEIFTATNQRKSKLDRSSPIAVQTTSSIGVPDSLEQFPQWTFTEGRGWFDFVSVSLLPGMHVNSLSKTRTHS